MQTQKETLAHLFFCEFYEIFKNTYFYRWLVAGSIVLLVVSFELFFCKRFTFLVLWLQVKIERFKLCVICIT